MDRFLFGGRGQRISSQPLYLPLNSLSFYQLDAGEQHRGSTSSSIFYLAANNPGKQQPRLGPSSLPERCCMAKEREGRRRLREREGEREKWREGDRKQEEMQRGSVYKCMWDIEEMVKREKEMEREMENRQSGWRRKRKRENNCVWIFFQTLFFLPRALSCSCCSFSSSRCDVQVVFWACLNPIPPLSPLSSYVSSVCLHTQTFSPFLQLSDIACHPLTFSTFFFPHSWFYFSILLEGHGDGHVNSIQSTGACQQPIFIIANVGWWWRQPYSELL